MATGQLRDTVELALIDQPDTVTFDLLDQLLHAPIRERYRRVPVERLLEGSVQDLRSVINALNILEKYGRNLLSPLRPKFWRSVKFNNPVFKATVDAIEGGRLVLSLYGYSCALSDGLGFPDGMQEPDLTAVAAVTADVIILHRELNLLISKSHPRQEEATQELLRGSLAQESLVTDSVSISPVAFSGALSLPTSRPPWQCLSCHTLNRGGSVLCVGCDRPRACTSSLFPGSLSPSQLLRDSWECQACTFYNAPSAVLCAVCDRPRLASKPSRDSHETAAVPGRESHETAAVPRRDSHETVSFPRRDSHETASVPRRDSHETAAFPRGESHETVAFPRRDSHETAAFPRRESHDTLVFPRKDSHETSAIPVGDSLTENIAPLKDSTGRGEERAGQEAWQCSHCTFYNTWSGRVCEMCDRTSAEPPATGGGGERDTCRLSHDQEETRQRKLREDGAKMVALIREGEGCGVPPEELCSAVQYSGTEVPLRWLQTELPYVLERVQDAVSRRGGGELGAVTPEEAREAWVSSGGDVEGAVTMCVTARRSKVEALCSLGFRERSEILAALFESAGDLGGALSVLQRPRLEAFHTRMWAEPEPPLQLDSGDRQALLRRLLAEHALPSWGRAELALSLLQESGGRYDLQDVLEAVRESQDRDFIKRMLTQECAVCGWELPRSKMGSLTSCECCICPDCFRTHFTVAVMEKHIRDMVCPACEEPEISDEGELLHYFSTLDILLRDALDVDAYNLFHKKLTERTLMKDPKFLWCTHCSFGFIYERDQLDVKCPQCDCSFCRECKRPWEEQHRSLSCEQFQSWKRENDAEYQAQGLAVYLLENGIRCPHCKFSYSLARGGCMHFICSQCRHQFCSGCYNTFHPKNKCIFPSCAVRMSLHAHHPRDCLFYLRDWEVSRLQRLLQISQVQFNTDPPSGTQSSPGGGCRVIEQKETLEGLRDEACGKETAPGYAGLCESHYKEYLVSRINALSVDPCALYDLGETVTVCQRYLPSLPPRGSGEDDPSYRERLLGLLITDVPLSQNIPRIKHS